MESDGLNAPTPVSPTPAGPPRNFSKTITATYAGLGFFGFCLLLAGFYGQYKAMVTRSLFLFILCALLLGLGIGFILVISGLHQRRNWARMAAVLFWLLCLVWTASRIVRNGLHPEAAPGPIPYSNAEQLAGARFTALVMPYLVGVFEITVMYCLLWKTSVVNQFKPRKQSD